MFCFKLTYFFNLEQKNEYIRDKMSKQSIFCHRHSIFTRRYIPAKGVKKLFLPGGKILKRRMSLVIYRVLLLVFYLSISLQKRKEKKPFE